MRFPLRLSAALFNAKFSRRTAANPIFRLSPLNVRRDDSSAIESLMPETAWHSAEECVRLAQSQGSPIVWLGACEPMFHPAIGEVASLLLSAGHHVFVHTCGQGLRRRIHEFTPDSRLFLTFEFAGREIQNDCAKVQSGPFPQIMEAIHAAKLSGFLVCAHVTVGAEDNACEIGELFEYLDGKDIDGFIVSCGGAVLNASETNPVRDKLEEVLSLLRDPRWEKFSRLLEASYATPPVVPAPAKVRGSEANAYQEGV